ncbi:MAG TPA: class I SAM-dependent methyltransferase [Nocardioides sp.]|nr:class I SAM-dependent methyltransferase [Nocardioides sp.]
MTTTTEPSADAGAGTAAILDEDRLNEFIGRFAGDLGAVMHCATVLIGDRLGLYAAIAENGPVSADGLAAATGYDARYLREWLSAQAASGYVEYDGEADTFWMAPEQVFALTSEDNPFFAPGGLEVAASTIRDLDLLTEAFRTGSGVPWGDHHASLFRGTDRFFKPSYIGNLVESWLPALDGAVERLQRGAWVADVGCGHGASTILMAEAFPRSTFVGFDTHAPSIEAARQAAERAGVADRVEFQVGSASDYPGAAYDLVAFFDCLHDMGDPVGAARHVRESLAADGHWLLVEPQAGDSLADNLNPVGRIFYSASTLICVPNSRSQETDLALGAQAGEQRLREVLTEGGFTRVRRATETPFNLVLEARP